jgi:quinol monooxygenase YgiN
MSKPIVFVSNQRIKEGNLEAYKQAVRRNAELLEASKPGTVAFLAYVNEEGTEASIVHVFPDAEAMELHMHGVGDRAKAGYEAMQTVSFEIYGKPSDAVLEMMKKVASSGTTVIIKPRPVGGYIRLKAR